MGEPNFPFRKLLVGTDFSRGAAVALRRAIALAKQVDAEVTLAHVLEHIGRAVEGTSFEAHWRIPPAALRRAEHKLRREAEARLKQEIKPYLRHVNMLHTDTLVGVAFVEIIRLVQAENYDLVVAGTKGLSGLKRVLVGSTAERLVRQCPCAVWVVKPDSQDKPQSILAPIDFTEVSRKSLRIAASLSRLFACPLDVLHAVNFHVDSVLEPPSEFGGTDERVRHREIIRASAQRLHDIVQNHVPTGIAVRYRLALGAPWSRITAAARRTQASIVVMGSVGRIGIPGFFIGNTSEKVLRRCDCSILTVKPDGFKSPVS